MVEKFPDNSEQRRSFRYPVSLAALVTNEQNAQRPARVTNISQEGLRLEGDRLFVEQVFPNDTHQGGLSQQRLRLQIALNEDEKITEANSITLICTSVYVLRQSQDCYQTGAYFCEIDETSRARLEQLIGQLRSIQTLKKIRDSRHDRHRS